MNNIIVTEVTSSGDGHYIVAIINDIYYKVRHDNPCTWENRDTAFKELLEQIPLNDRPAVEAEYDRYCEGLRNAEAEAEKLANMTDEERLAMFEAEMVKMGNYDTAEYEEIHEETEE